MTWSSGPSWSSITGNSSRPLNCTLCGPNWYDLPEGEVDGLIVGSWKVTIRLLLQGGVTSEPWIDIRSSWRGSSRTFPVATDGNFEEPEPEIANVQSLVSKIVSPITAARSVFIGLFCALNVDVGVCGASNDRLLLNSDTRTWGVLDWRSGSERHNKEGKMAIALFRSIWQADIPSRDWMKKPRDDGSSSWGPLPNDLASWLLTLQMEASSSSSPKQLVVGNVILQSSKSLFMVQLQRQIIGFASVGACLFEKMREQQLLQFWCKILLLVVVA